MESNRRFFAPISLLLCLLVTFACQKAPAKTYDPAKNYRRIAACNNLSAKILWKLGKKVRSRVIAVPHIIDEPRFSNFTGRWPKSLARIHRVGEEVVALKPDLMILAHFHSGDVKALLRNIEIDYLLLEPFTGFRSYLANIERIGEAAGKKDKAAKLVENFNLRLDKIKKRAAEMPTGKSILSYMYGNTMGVDSTFDDVVSHAGLAHTGAIQGIKNYGKISPEQVAVWQPDYIAISCGGQGKCKQAVKKFRKQIAVKLKGQVLAFPTNLMTATDDDMLKLAESIQEAVINGGQKF